MRYEDYTVKELKVKCKEKGLSGYSHATKPDLLVLLRGKKAQLPAVSKKTSTAVAKPSGGKVAKGGTILVARAAKQIKFRAAGFTVAEVVARVSPTMSAKGDDTVLVDGKEVKNPEKTILKPGQRLTFMAPVGSNL